VRASNLVAAAVTLLAACWSAEGQPSPSLIFSPSVLLVGSGPSLLHISVVQGQAAGLGVRWNGVDKPATADSNPSFSGGYDIELTAEDLAAPAMAQVSMYDLRTGATVTSGYVFVGYNIVPNDVVFDQARNRFYLTTPTQSTDPSFPANSLVALDSANNHIGPVLAIGNHPTSLAPSDDGNSLYVAVDADGLIRRVDLDTFAVTGEFRVRSAFTGYIGPYARSAIAVMPGHPQTVAIYHHPDINSSLASIAVYDDGQKRPSEIDSSSGYDSLLFAPDGKSLFLGSYANLNSPQSVLHYDVDATGIPKQTPTSISGGGPVTIQNGLLYTSRGTIIDIQKMQIAGLLGVGGAVAVDLSNQRIFAVHFISRSNAGDYPQYLQTFDLATQEPLGWQSLDSWNYFSVGGNSGQRLFRFGSDGLLYTGNKALLLFHTPLAGPAPVSGEAAVVNAASQQSGPIAPGEILSIYGTNLGPAAPVIPEPSTLAFPSILGNTQVWFDSLPGALLMAHQNQINVVAPFELQPGSTVNVQVWNMGIPSAKIRLSVAQTAPALITRNGSGTGPAAIVNQDGTVNMPAPAGSTVMLYGTGGGVIPEAVDGALARRAANLAAPVRVSLAGRDVPVVYAGAAPGLVNGVFQLNVQIPSDLPAGTASITVNINGQDSPRGVTLEIR
jgi:uncharacterized protein (TIGR03437 family)